MFPKYLPSYSLVMSVVWGLGTPDGWVISLLDDQIKDVPQLSDQGFGNMALSLDNLGETRGRGSMLVCI